MKLISHAGVQDGNFMRLCDQINCFRELRGYFWVPWLWLRKINPQQRAQIPANERKYPQTSANLKYVFFRIHPLCKNLMKTRRMHMDYLLGTLSGHKLHNHRAVVTILMKPRKKECPQQCRYSRPCHPMSMTEIAGVLKGWFVALFLAALQTSIFFINAHIFPRAFIYALLKL